MEREIAVRDFHLWRRRADRSRHFRRVVGSQSGPILPLIHDL